MLLDMGAGRRITIDDVGTLAWALLDEQPTFAGLVGALCDEGTRVDELARDVARLLTEWLKLGVVSWR